MPNIKTIKPDGSGDYTSLSDWWTYATAQTDAAQWAECYEGGNYGFPTLSDSSTSWNNQSADNYPRIYAAEGESPSGGFLSLTADFAQMKGMTWVNGATMIRASLIDSCIIDSTNTAPHVDGTLFENCVLGTSRFSVLANATLTYENCSVDGNFVVSSATDNVGFNVVIRNCIAASYPLTTATVGTNSVTITYSLSADNTANDFDGGTGVIVDEALSDVYTDESGSFTANDYTLKENSPAIDAGEDNGLTVDILGVSRSGDFDMGAYEVAAAESEINIKDGSTSIADGETTPVDFETVSQGDTVPSKTFTIENTGGDTLTISNITVPTGYSIVQSPSSITAGGSDSLIVSLTNTNSIGSFLGDVVITSNDSDEAVYNFAIRTSVIAPTYPIYGPLGVLPKYTFEVTNSNRQSDSPYSDVNQHNYSNENTDIYIEGIGKVRSGDRFIANGQLAINVKEVYIDEMNVPFLKTI